MARPKRSSAILRKAEKRQSGLRAIDPKLDLGYQLTLENYSALIETLRSQIATHNCTLSTLDGQSLQIKETELQLRQYSEQMLLGVAAKYGKDSREYGNAGGTPKSERRRPTPKKTAQSHEPLQPVAIAPSANSKAPESVNGNHNGNGKALIS